MWAIKQDNSSLAQVPTCLYIHESAWMNLAIYPQACLKNRRRKQRKAMRMRTWAVGISRRVSHRVFWWHNNLVFGVVFLFGALTDIKLFQLILMSIFLQILRERIARFCSWWPIETSGFFYGNNQGLIQTVEVFAISNHWQLPPRTLRVL